MSKLTIVDLHRTKELSRSDIAKVAGGMSCLGQQARMMAFYSDLADTFYNIGAPAAANAMRAKELEIGAQECPP